MVIKIVAFIFSILMIYVFANTYYESIHPGKENGTNELEKEEEVWNFQILLRNESEEQFDSFNSPNQNSDDKKMFFVITAIYNPASYQSRNNLYRNFVEHMNTTGAQLITIECIFPLLNQTEFQVTDANNPWHIQLKSESFYWMKENLINIAVSRLPPHAKWVCWLDADIEFENPNWVELTIEKLQMYTVVQMFELGHFLGPDPENEILRIDYSFGYCLVHNKKFEDKNNKLSARHPGYGWAMAVEDFREINGLPYYNIIGSGDNLFAYSLTNAKSFPFGKNKKKLHPEYLKMMIDNLSLNFPKLLEIAHSQGKMIVGYLPVTLRHFWHGSRKSRQYSARYGILADDQFNFNTDVTITEEGLLKFKPNKTNLQKRFIEFQGYQ